jgi:serine/threonine-protein kinase
MGIVLWEALVGELLFPSHASRAAALAAGWVLPRPSEKNRDVTPALDAVVLKLMANEPDRRYATAEAAAAALASACPLAPPSEVAEWVRAVASERLAKIDELLQHALRSGSGLLDLEAAQTDPSPPPVMDVTPPPAPKRRRGGAVALVLAGLIASGASAVAVIKLRQMRASRTAVATTASVAPEPVPPPVVSSLAAAPAPDPPPIESAKPSESVAPRPTGTRRHNAPGPPASSRSRCDPPYFFDKDGVKIYRPECVMKH